MGVAQGLVDEQVHSGGTCKEWGRGAMKGVLGQEELGLYPDPPLLAKRALAL